MDHWDGMPCASGLVSGHQRNLPQVSETVILPEMLTAGIEALAECEVRHFSNQDTVIAIYLAMEAIKEIAIMRKHYEVVH